MQEIAQEPEQIAQLLNYHSSSTTVSYLFPFLIQQPQSFVLPTVHHWVRYPNRVLKTLDPAMKYTTTQSPYLKAYHWASGDALQNGDRSPIDSPAQKDVRPFDKKVVRCYSAWTTTKASSSVEKRASPHSEHSTV